MFRGSSGLSSSRSRRAISCFSLSASCRISQSSSKFPDTISPEGASARGRKTLPQPLELNLQMYLQSFDGSKTAAICRSIVRHLKLPDLPHVIGDGTCTDKNLRHCYISKAEPNASSAHTLHISCFLRPHVNSWGHTMHGAHYAADVIAVKVLWPSSTASILQGRAKLSAFTHLLIWEDWSGTASCELADGRARLMEANAGC